MKKQKLRKEIWNIFLIILGTFLLAASVNLVYEPLEMVTGGVSGLAIIIKNFTSIWIDGGLPVWVSNVLLNGPLFLAAFYLKGWTFVKKTLFATISFTVALYVIPTVDIVYQDYLLAAVFGGVIGGAGLGMVFTTHTTTGGTDLLSMLINKFKPYYSVPQILIVVDGLIVLGGVISFGVSKSLYAIIAVYITAKVSDGILEGLKFAKMIYIISDKHEEIAKSILDKLDRGVTGLAATGMYSNNDKKMLLCVVSKKEIIELNELVADIDRKAFIIVTDVREVMGEGFREYRQ